jgi:twitching motility protein PilJ
MSVVDQLKKLFSKKRPAESEADLSLGMPDGSMDPMATGAMEAPGTMAMAPVEERVDEAPASRMAAEDEMMVPPVDESELVSVPLLGRRTIVQHQRILFILLAFALVVLGAVTVFALNQADRVAQQVAGTGQSLMQSQRLAKSVSQALVGSPLMERAEKNAGTVMGQQKILTQVGNALRTINRQSSDLLEIAETMSSLKLQQNAAAAEISASGQLVMLTQRIGKSANEFLTMEGVSPEAVFLLGKDLNSFKEIAQGLLDGSPELRLAGSKDEQTRERLDALIKLYEQTHAARLAPFWATCRAWCPRVRRRPRSLPTASRCAGHWKTCRASCLPRRAWARGLGGVGDASAVVRHSLRGGPGLCAAAGQPQASGGGRTAATGSRARSRKPSASTTPTRPPFCV